MAITDYLITSYDGKDVASAPDELIGSADENKAVFDRLVKEVVVPKHNGLVYEIINNISASGSWVGNGSATQRTIDTGTKGNVAIVYTAAKTVAIVYPYGAISMGNSAHVSDPSTMKFENGVFTIKHATSYNYPNYVYNYCVL